MKKRTVNTAVLALALVMAVRMLGLFMILPVFSMHATEFAHATPQLIGLALGIYGLTQALLQMPFGILSDRIGRKPVMTLGLGLFLAGSVYAAVTHSIYGLIIGRALQGGGAVGSTILATIADLTPEHSRSQAMGLVGLAIGLAFGIAMVLGPLLNTWFNLSGIFWATALLAVIGELLVWWWIPAMPRMANQPRESLRTGLVQVLSQPDLLRLDAGIFVLHAILTALFIAIPIILTHMIHLSSLAQTGLYLGVLSLAFILMLPFMIIAEKKRRTKPILLVAITCLLLAQCGLWVMHQQLFWVCGLLLLFFTAFSLLEAVLPSWISRVAPANHKGAAMGCYSSAQFLGIFAGGCLGGLLYAHFSITGVLLFGAGLALAWLLLALNLRPFYGIAELSPGR